MKIKEIFFLLAILFFFGRGILYAQDQPVRLQSEKVGSAGISLEYWKAEDDQIVSFSLPLTFLYPYSDKIRFYATTAPSTNSLNTGTSYSLSGLSDLKIGGHALILNDQYLLTFGFNLPTGKSGMATDEYPVASVLTMPAFNFRVPSLGQGFDIQAGINGAREMGEFILGYGVSYLMKGGFKPYQDNDASYNPGEEITFTVGADRTYDWFDRDVRMTGDILYTIYTNDTWEGEEIFKSGNSLIFQIQSLFKVKEYDCILFIRERMKGKNKTGSGDFFDTERKNSNINQFQIQAIASKSTKPDLRIRGIVDLKLYSNNGYGTGGATLLGLGAGGKYQMSPRLVLDAECRIYFGSIVTSYEGVSAYGVQLFGGLQYTL